MDITVGVVVIIILLVGFSLGWWIRNALCNCKKPTPGYIRIIVGKVSQK